MSAKQAAAYAHCQGLVRSQDPDRYYAALFAPPDLRRHLFALYAFSAEVGGIRGAVSSPMPGEIRLQWWRDALNGEARGDAAAHPVASALDETISAFNLPRPPLLDLIEARTFDLYDDPMPSVGDLDGYLGETSSALVRVAALIMGRGHDPGGADAAGHAGIAIGIAGLLRALPWHAREGRLYLPKDLLDRNGVTRDDVVLGRGGPGFVAALAELRELARGHLFETRARIATITPAIRPAFLPAALVDAYLARMERPGFDPFSTVVDLPAWRKIARMWKAKRAS